MEYTRKNILPTENNAIDILVSLLKKRDYANIICKGEEYINIFPYSFKFYRTVGIAYFNCNKLIKAKLYFEKAINLNILDLSSHIFLSLILNKLGKFDDSITFLKRALNIFPSSHNLAFNLANAYYYAGNISESIFQFNQAINFKKDFFQAYGNLGKLLISIKKYNDAEFYLKKSLQINKTYIQAYEHLAELYYKNLNFEKAINLYSKILHFDPKNGNALHMLSALNANTTKSPPEDYVTNLFDNFADTFDELLVKKLGYNAPKFLKNYFQEVLPIKNNYYNTVDIGCGTGLSGIEFKKFSKHILGIDLSSNMLKKAKKTNVYNQLILGEAEKVLQSQNKTFNLFIATDVFIYMGDLSSLFFTIKTKSTKNSVFLFCTEHYDQSGYFLNKSGRYAHSEGYINDLCKINKFKILLFKKQKLRKKNNKWLIGGYYVVLT